MKEYSGRVGKTLHNTTIGLAGQIATYLLTFAYRTIFIRILGAEYLGVQGLFSNILSILSLAELGIGSAITFSLYKPLVNNDQIIIRSLMKYYAKAYSYIGIIVAIIGLSLTPFLDYFIKDKPDISNITGIYLLYLANSVSSYYFSYKRSIIVADQKGYINTTNINIFAILRTILQSTVLILYKNFILTLIIQIVCSIISNISISYSANKLYPYLKDKDTHPLDKILKTDLVKKIRAMVFHQVGSVIVLGTDNLLISRYVGIYWVGIYSNYILIIGIINTVIQQFTQSVVASVGNLVSTATISKTKETFDVLFFVNYWIYSFCSICLLTLFNPFITIWLGPTYLFNFEIVLFIVLNFYITGMRQNVLSFRNALGLFWNDRYKPVFEAIINLVASIILLKLYGIIGVFIGTFISTITTSLWVEPYILFKHYFKQGLMKYFAKYLMYTTVTAMVALSMQLISNYIFKGDLVSFILLCTISIFTINFLFCVIFFRTKQFIFALSLIKHILHREK